MLYLLSLVSQPLCEQVRSSSAVFGFFPVLLGIRPTRVGVSGVTDSRYPSSGASKPEVCFA